MAIQSSVHKDIHKVQNGTHRQRCEACGDPIMPHDDCWHSYVRRLFWCCGCVDKAVSIDTAA